MFVANSRTIVKEKGLIQISDAGELEVINKVLENQQSIVDIEVERIWP